ncbi:GNAT family N-acetyltransferase [Lachnospiraceae bacterium WCA-9-b2]|uniref:GNAT family N-acetyltransferase n=2 Tax=Sporofaciens musculi TaxID=2681861 RepID=A0A7X3MKJ5_9FIRM|nr:GNAT family N-acetyltransferase [Sporofaciens musculi]
MYQIYSCSEEDKKNIIDGLVAYNLTCVPATQEELFVDLSRKAVSKSGEIMGGIIARMYCWGCVDVDALWVSEKYRGIGLGKTLLSQVEASARKKGACLIHLDTFDFQARGLYESQGYEVFGVLKNCPPGHERYYMKKCL